ncbi:MAG: hypothetical protein WDA75_03130 [Candidatus Latescibacterota bacterium]|jgi:hypothetical protein
MELLLSRLTPPGSLPVQASVPFAAGACPTADRIRILAPDGGPLVTQSRELLRWPDGSVKWALVLFAPTGSPSVQLEIAGGGPPPDPPLATVDGDRLRIDTGQLRFSVRRDQPEDVYRRDEGILTDLECHRDGSWMSLTTPRLDAGLVAQEADDTIYSSQLAGPGFVPARGLGMADAGVSLIEAGPLRCLVRMAGKLCHGNYRS